MMNPKQYIGIIIAVALLFNGCSLGKVSQPAFSATVKRGYYSQALAIARGEIGRHNTYHDLLWNLQAGTMLRLLKDYKASNDSFDLAEDAYRHFDQQSLLGKSGETSKAMVFNDSALTYTGKHYERVMVNTYKALNFAALGDSQNARVEFNRALTRQNEAKSYFAIEAQRLEVERAAQNRSEEANDDVVETTLNNPKLNSILSERYKNLESFTVYSDFINPYTNFCAGLYFWLKDDTGKAVDLLKEAHAMNQNNGVIRDVFQRASQGNRPLREMWILFENGIAPRRQEMHIDIPILLQQANIKYVGTAFANLTEGHNAFEYVKVTTTSGNSTTTTPFASMASVIAQEFKKEMKFMTTREISRVALKTYFQYQMNEQYGPWAGIASAIYQAATTGVDLRSWSSLPNEFQVGYLNIGQDMQVTLTAGGKTPVTINLPSEFNNMILYVRAIDEDVPLAYDIISF